MWAVLVKATKARQEYVVAHTIRHLRRDAIEAYNEAWYADAFARGRDEGNCRVGRVLVTIEAPAK